VLLAGAIACLAVAAASACASGSRPADDRWNVLLITSDDMRTDLGSYGTAEVRTPNLDALARRGVRFDRAYSQYPLCNPSRTSMLTGRYPLRTGVLDQHARLDELHPEFVTLPRYFREHGWVTLCAGKIFHAGFDDTAAWVEGADRGRPQIEGDEAAERGPARRRPMGDRVAALPDTGARHPDLDAVAEAIAYLRRDHEAPFFLALGVTKPHPPPAAPRSLVAAYPPGDVPLPVDFRPRAEASPGFPAVSITPNRGLFVDREATAAEARRMKAAYWASMTWTDANVGRVLHELDALGLAERTVVVFWSDHGFHLGEKGKWAKDQSLYEPCARTPLLIAAPGARGNGGVVAHPVESVDLFATLCELAGLDAPDGLDGVSLAPLLADPAAAWDRPAFTVVADGDMLGVAVRSERWRYAEWAAGAAGAMLIDEQEDPAETVNRIDDPMLAPVRERLARLAREHAAIGR